MLTMATIDRNARFLIVRNLDVIKFATQLGRSLSLIRAWEPLGCRRIRTARVMKKTLNREFIPRLQIRQQEKGQGSRYKPRPLNSCLAQPNVCQTCFYSESLALAASALRLSSRSTAFRDRWV